MPMGNFLLNRDLVLMPKDIQKVVDFCYATTQEQKIIVYFGDNIGYCSDKYESILKNCAANDSARNLDYHWHGCPAGKTNLGIRANGHIYGCLAIRDEKYCAGDIRKTSLMDIWKNDRSFAWNRELKKENLGGFCGKCQHGDRCLGGCSAQKLTFGSIYADNPNCLYRQEIEALTADIAMITEPAELIKKANKYVAVKNYQAAEVYISKAISFITHNVDLLNFAGFINYFLKNYQASLEFNDHSLSINPQQAYTLRGKGMCLYKLGRTGEAISLIYRAMTLADRNEFDDICYDLAVVLMESNRYNEAMQLIENAQEKSETFGEKSRKLYLICKEKRL
jgi:radical SAM protein with 4Fe4S-binding SPASM domain